MVRTPISARGSARGARKALSQNFLHSPSVLRVIVRESGVHPGDLVLEPGAGEGTLTRALAGAARRIVAYELDPALAARLPRRLDGLANVSVVAGDFLEARAPRAPFAVVGNIPYARTSAIVRWCLTAPRLTSATLLTQREYARKRTGDYGRWSRQTVLTWPEFAWRLGPRVARHHFTPVPRTDSAVLVLRRRPTPLLPPDRLAAYRTLVTEGFTGVGGSLAATLSLRHRAGRVRAALHTAGVPPSAPVGLVTPDQWLRLFQQLRP
ncbi:ErmE/ErmH/ErmO/ErmR family 23S rRNA (adenine(2058)-N(6))-methyltransferase [Streptomyces sp. B6B3]|uniref:ErmE/ErmH/ErmO/ErmR family 23S rRNA (adenine(2058)-N(6))-methyltransferase n=1 Tax=Streptomyces sp. B6B3 TaxID=3153570 RepID=UPI00325F0FB0